MRVSGTRGAPVGEVVLLTGLAKEVARSAALSSVPVGRFSQGRAVFEQWCDVARRCVGARSASLERRVS